MAKKRWEDVVREFGIAARAKLSSPVVSGAPEDQLRAPLETFIRDSAEVAGLAPGKVALVGEATLSELNSRPDYAVTVWGALAGFIEIKAPGKGADPRRFADPHDKAQWKKLQSLPNLLYTDGNSFSLWRDGEAEGKIIHLDGDIATSGTQLRAPETLLALIADFLQWKPQPPKSPKNLAEVSARLCRLLREEVIEQLAVSNASLTALASDWRDLLFPEANDAQFADGYAQAVSRPVIGDRRPPSPLGDIQPSGWLDEYTQDLLDLLNVLGRLIKLEPAQASLLDDICAGPLYSGDTLAKLWTPPGTGGKAGS